MNEIFGVPITSIVIGLLILLSICLLFVAWVAWRRPVIFKLGIRNIPRRRAQTTLIVVGLMLSTLIIAASLATGDTLNHSITAAIYDLIGEVDEIVVYSQDVEGETNSSLSHKIQADSLTLVENALADNPNVEAIGGILFEEVPVINETTRQSEPVATLVGISPATVDAFGGIKSLDGAPIDLAATAPDEVVLSETAADHLDASVGDRLTTYYANQPINLTVAAIAPDSVLTGVFDPGNAGILMPLDRMQAATGQPDQLSAIIISNAGDARAGVALSDAVADALKPALSGQSLGVVTLKQDAIEMAEQDSEAFTSLFLVFGLFSIAAGILLIVLIFTMLAAERRSEMGMARAVGQQRRQLIQQFVSEGTGYAILAGLVGSALGVVAAVGIAAGLQYIVGDYFDIEPHIEPRSLVVAYCLGVVITFIAVVGSSWKVSRLNIVAAVRDIPDVTSPRRKRSTIVWGVILVLLGGLLTLSGANGSAPALYTGISVLPFGIANILRYLGVPSRPVLTVVGLFVLTLWLLPEDQSKALFGSYDAGIEMFFLSGIFIVASTTLVIVQNLTSLLALLTRVGSLFRSKLPAVRTAVAYPGAAHGRTGMTIAMFSLIIFSLVMIATINQNFIALFLSDEASAGWDVRVQVGPTNPVNGFIETLEANGVDTTGFKATGKVTTQNQFSAQVRLAGESEWKDYPFSGMDDTFISESELKFQQRAKGYETDAAIIEALLTQPNVAVIDSYAVPSDGSVAADPDRFLLTGITTGDKVFDPITVEIYDPDSSQPATVTIIGVIDTKIASLAGLFASERTFDAIFPERGYTSYFVSLTDPERAADVAKEIEAALLPHGAQAISIREQLEEAQRQSSSFLYIIQGFMALGLIVGVAAVGVIAFRSVVERRQQIGVLRALGFQRGTVALSFVIESAFVVALGVLAGASTGLLLSFNLVHSEDFGGSKDFQFMIPWGLLSVIIAATIAAALLMTWMPARQAARIAPAEALRYE